LYEFDMAVLQKGRAMRLRRLDTGIRGAVQEACLGFNK
jgi:hypothetical protein